MRRAATEWTGLHGSPNTGSRRFRSARSPTLWPTCKISESTTPTIAFGRCTRFWNANRLFRVSAGGTSSVQHRVSTWCCDGPLASAWGIRAGYSRAGDKHRRAQHANRDSGSGIHGEHPWARVREGTGRRDRGYLRIGRGARATARQRARYELDDRPAEADRRPEHRRDRRLPTGTPAPRSDGGGVRGRQTRPARETDHADRRGRGRTG